MGRLKNAAQRAVNAAWRATHSHKPQKRSFKSAQVSSLTSSWATQPKPIDVDIRNGLRKLRARSRYEAQNNDYVRRFLSMVKTNVVGAPGIILQSKVIDPHGKPDPIASAAIEAAWADWGRGGTADVTGRLSWKMIQRLYIETMARDGEVIVRKVKGWKRNKYRFALQFIDPEALDVELNRDLASGNTIRMGVELDAWRKPVAYHLLTGASTADAYQHMGRNYQRIDAGEIIHQFLPEWCWQTRGVPWVSTGLLRLNMLAGYEEAELVASRASAAKFAVYERKDEDAPAFNAGQVGEEQPDGTFAQDFESGTVGVTPDGYSLNLIDPQHPNSAYRDFIKASLRGIAAGLGVTYNGLANDLEGVNYSSLRQGALDERAVWMMLQDWMIESFCDHVYRDWLSVALLAQAVKINNTPLKDDRFENYLNVSWQPRRWQWVDPLKEMMAHQAAFAHKIKTPQSVIRDMGQNPEDVLDEWKSWQAMLDARDLKTDPIQLMEADNADEDD